MYICIYTYIYTCTCIDIYIYISTDDDDVYLGYHSGKMISYKLPCLHVLRKTRKLRRYGIC
jgi:hypothetical protein